MARYDLFGSAKEKLEVENTKSSQETTVVQRKTCLWSFEMLLTVYTAKAVFECWLSAFISKHTGDFNIHYILHFALFHFNLTTTVILIASFVSMFNRNICLSKQEDGCTALQALTDIHGLFPTGLLGQNFKPLTEMLTLWWMALWEQSEDKTVAQKKKNNAALGTY